jgi:hypothetical protein
MNGDEKKGTAEDDGTLKSDDEAERSDGGDAQESEAQADEVIIRPYGGKVGEAGDNLRGREGWFRRRTGGGG